MKEIRYAAASLWMILWCVCGCTEKENPETVLETKSFFLSNGEEATRVSIDAGNAFDWTGGETVKYYCTSGETGAKTTTAGSPTVSAGRTSQVTVGYNKATDKYIAFYYRGSNLSGGTTTETSGASLTLAKGVPASQKGDVLSNLACVGYVQMDEESASLKNMQAFLQLRFSSATIGDKAVTSIKVTDRASGNIAGDLLVNPNAGTAALGTGNLSKTITVSPDGGVAADKDYYIAIAPKTYSSGLKLTFINGPSTEVGYVEINKSIKPESGKFLNLGALNPHTTVIGKTATMLCGTTLSLAPGMTKKLYVKVTPSDVTKCTWSVTEATAGTSATIVADGQGKENIGGTDYFVTTLTIGSETGSCKVNVTLEGNTSPNATCTVTISDFVDLGLSVLWARSNVNVDADGLCPNEYDPGGYYYWGWVTPVTSGTKGYYDTYANNSNKWTTATTGLWSVNDYNTRMTDDIYPKGGRYYSSSYGGINEKKLRSEDDVAYKASSGAYRMPTSDELAELKANTAMIPGKSGGKDGYFFKSTKIGYEDTQIFMPNAGTIEPTLGNLLCFGIGGGIWGSEIYETEFFCAVNVGKKSGVGGFRIEKTYKLYSEGDRLLFGVDCLIYGRIMGRSIRPVKDK